jgi:hypothetical protein
MKNVEGCLISVADYYGSIKIANLPVLHYGLSTK